ncbi:unnamed protein product, partial [Scytosiphon promiscuus]
MYIFFLLQARRRAKHMRRSRAALRTQTAFRRHAARSKFLSLRGAAVALQCASRWRKAVKIAYAELRDLRIKAKDVGKLKGDNERLKAEL